ncbi:MAG: serine hydrolase domain-containing protein [Paracoccaceae bacterium]
MSQQSRLNTDIDAAIRSGLIVGAHVRVARDGAVVFDRHAGFAAREKGVAVEGRTIFRLASVTSPMIAATALALIDPNLTRLDSKVTDFLPYFEPRLTDDTMPEIALHHPLTHTAGLSHDYLANRRFQTG